MKESTRRGPGSRPLARSNSAKKEGRTKAKTTLTEKRGSETLSGAAGRGKGTAQPRTESREEKALSTIVFVQLSQEAFDSFGPMGLKPGVPLPVQTPGPIARFDASLISAESIIAGILRVLAWQPENKNAGYYREFVKKVRPGLLAELSDAGVAKAQAREWEVAEEIFLALTGLYPEKPEPLLDLALLHEEHARLLSEELQEERAEAEDDLAFQCYRKLLTIEPPFAPAYYHAAFFYVRKRTFDRAVSLLTTFIGMSDDEAKVNRAKEVLKKLKDLGYLDNTFKEAYDFIQMGEEEKGLEKAKVFVERYPDVWNGWFLVGWANRRLRNWEEGRAAFAKAISLGAQEADTYNEMAICQIELNDLSGARASLEQALRIEPENVKIIANLGALAYRLGRKGEASGFFRSALEIDPDDELAKDWLARIGMEE